MIVVEQGEIKGRCVCCGRVLDLSMFGFIPSRTKYRSRCKECTRITEREYPKKTYRERAMEPGFREQQAKYVRARRHKLHINRPMHNAKDTSAYLGVYVAEKVLASLFENTKRMPYGNPGYDFICGKGYKIDCKCGCRNKRVGRGGADYWVFTLEHNTIADYFLCLAFNDRTELTPEHVWLIPGNKVNHLDSLHITESRMNKWESFQKPIKKVQECCEKFSVSLKPA